MPEAYPVKSSSNLLRFERSLSRGSGPRILLWRRSRVLRSGSDPNQDGIGLERSRPESGSRATPVQLAHPDPSHVSRARVVLGSGASWDLKARRAFLSPASVAGTAEETKRKGSKRKKVAIADVLIGFGSYSLRH